MNIVVCVKQVPDRNSRFEIDSSTNHVRFEGLKFETNEFDRYAVEEALHLRDASGGEVTVLTVGPDRAKEVLNKALAMGADKAIHVNDERIGGSDAHGIATIIAAVLKDRAVDLILCGAQSEDQGYAQTGVLVAEMLDIPFTTVVLGTELKDGGILARRELEGGAIAPVEMSFPCLLTIQTGINEPRYPTLPGIMKAKSKPQEKLTLDDIGVAPDVVGTAGCRSEVLELFFPEERDSAELIEGDVPEAVDRLARILKEKENVI